MALATDYIYVIYDSTTGTSTSRTVLRWYSGTYDSTAVESDARPVDGSDYDSLTEGWIAVDGLPITEVTTADPTSTLKNITYTVDTTTGVVTATEVDASLSDRQKHVLKMLSDRRQRLQWTQMLGSKSDNTSFENAREVIRKIDNVDTEFSSLWTTNPEAILSESGVAEPTITETTTSLAERMGDLVSDASILATKLRANSNENIIPVWDMEGVPTSAFTLSSGESISFISGATDGNLKGASGANVMELTRDSNAAVASVKNTKMVPIEGGETYFVNYGIRSTTTASINLTNPVYAAIEWYDASQAAIGSPTFVYVNSTNAIGTYGQVIVNTEYRSWGSKVVAPDNARYVIVRMSMNTNYPDNTLRIGKVRFRLANAARLLTDSSVVTNHINDSAITSPKILLGSATRIGSQTGDWAGFGVSTTANNLNFTTATLVSSVTMNVGKNQRGAFIWASVLMAPSASTDTVRLNAFLSASWSGQAETLIDYDSQIGWSGGGRMEVGLMTAASIPVEDTDVTVYFRIAKASTHSGGNPLRYQYRLLILNSVV